MQSTVANAIKSDAGKFVIVVIQIINNNSACSIKSLIKENWLYIGNRNIKSLISRNFINVPNSYKCCELLNIES